MNLPAVLDQAIVEHLASALAVGPSFPDRSAVRSRAAKVLRPSGALARLDEVAVWLAGWQRTPQPAVQRPHVVVFAADHGVNDRGVSAYPSSITGAMVGAIEAGLATCSVLAEAEGAGLTLVDVGVGRPTHDLAVADALTLERFTEAWFAGVAAVGHLDTDLLILGELGIGNSTAAAAVACALCGGSSGDWVGRGTGIDDDGLARKRGAVDLALTRLAGGGDRSPLSILRRVGGAELVALAGAAVEARRRSLPIILDGFIATAALAPLEATAPGLLDHCIAGHASAEGGHRRLLEQLSKRPLLELDLRLGEASGALFALPLVRLAAAAVVRVATFDELG